MKALAPYDLPLDGAHLIEASAGTGKTFTIATLVLRLILEAGLTIDQILVVTFTRAATAELRDRIRRRLAEAHAIAALEAPRDDGAADVADRLARRRAEGHGPADAAALTAALRAFDTAPIFTIHGFCQRVLQEFAFESGMSFEATLAEDELALRREIVADYWSTATHAAPPSLVAYLLGPPARLTPAKLDRLADAVGRARGIEWTPPAPGDAPAADVAVLAGAVEAWRAARAAAAAALAADRAEVEAVLTLSPDLDHRKLSRAHVPRWLDQVGAWLRGDAAPPSGADIRSKWERFAASAVAEATKDGRATPRHPFFDACERLLRIDDDLAGAMARWADGIRLGLLPYLRRETEARLRRANAQTFDDLLHDLAAALEDDQGRRLAALARRRYGAALIDEFQDTDDVQYRILRALFGAAADASAAPFLALIGDPKQAIYGFRGADVHTYLKAAGDVGPDRSWTLGTNYRADRGLVAAVNAVWSDARLDRPFVHPGIGFHAVDAVHNDRLCAADAATAPPAPLTILTIDAGDAEDEIGRDGLIKKDWAERVIPRRVALDIAALLTGGTRIPADGEGGAAGGGMAADGPQAASPSRPLAPGDIAVLTRTNGQAESVHQALLRLGLPSVRQGDASVFDSDEAEALARVLAAVLEPGDGRLVRAALVTPLFGCDAARLATIADDETAWEEEVERFRAWRERWRRLGFIQAFRRLMDEADVARACLALPDGERRLTNVLHLGELLHRAAHDEGYGPGALLAWLRRLRTDAAARTATVGDSAQLRLERDGMAIQVVTIHRSKGLEYPVVYLPYLWHHTDGPSDADAPIRYHDPAVGRPRLDVADRSDPDRAVRAALAQIDGFAEDLRLAYVALTRAKHHCAVVWGPIAGAAKSALGRLIHPLSAPADAATEEDALGGAADVVWLDAVRAHVERRLADPTALAGDVANLVGACPAGIAARPLAHGPAPHRAPAVAAPPVLAARTLPRPIPRGRRRTSYSTLTADRRDRRRPDAERRAEDDRDVRDEHAADEHAVADAEALRDHDAAATRVDDADGVAVGWAPPAATVEAVDGDAAVDGAGQAMGASDGPSAAPFDRAAPVTLHAFPAGADPGTCLHAILERIDFADDERWPVAIDDACRRAGLERFAEPLPAALAEIVRTQLPADTGAFTLEAVRRGDRVNEMAFVLPVAIGAEGGDAGEAFHPADLAAALAADGAAGLPDGYPAAVAELGFEAVRGHLGGFIDMVFRAGERWYIVDWKSNRLGPSWDDYTPAAIAQAMAHHHYYVQYHLYTVAVHRYLARRVPGYAYPTHFGGVFYLFVRGMHPRLGPARGIFFDRPPEARVARLDALFTGAPRDGVGAGRARTDGAR